MKKTIVLGAFIVIVVVAVSLVYFNHVLSGSGPKTTDTRSSIFKTSQQRIAFLEKYVDLYSSVKDAEFHIVYRNGSAGLSVPSPSEWSMVIAMQMDKTNLAKWVSGLVQDKQFKGKLTWGYDLIQGKPNWVITSTPQSLSKGDGNRYRRV